MSQNETIIKAESGKQDYYIEREFEAPRSLVFKAFKEPELLLQWLGPYDLPMKIEKYEAKAGGSFRYTYSRKPGVEYGFHGVFHESLAPEFMIYTIELEGLPEKGHVCLSTTRFIELPGNRTRVVIQDLYQSVADRDMALKSGMEKGVRESNERLDALLEKSR